MVIDRYGLFTSWKFGFVFDDRLHQLQLHPLSHIPPPPPAKCANYTVYM